MKRLLNYLLLFTISISSYAQGVSFQNLSFKEAFAKAEKEGKAVLMMFGTTHCGYSMMLYYDLIKNKELGDLLNDKFVCVAYGDSTFNYWKDYHYSESRKKNMKRELHTETVLGNSFVYPNTFLFNAKGDLLYINPIRNSKFTTKLANQYISIIEKGEQKRPLFFRFKFNAKQYKKNKHTYKMLTAAIKCYNLFDVDPFLDFKDSTEINTTEFRLSPNKTDLAQKYINESLSYGTYYFNSFLASIISMQKNELAEAKKYAKQAIESVDEFFHEPSIDAYLHRVLGN